MTINKIKERLLQGSVGESAWIKNAKAREENRAWLDISFEIAVSVASVLNSNKEEKKSPKNQKELAEIIQTTPQYVNKVLKGKEKLNIETISKLQKALGVNLIKVLNPNEIKDISFSRSEIELPRKSLSQYRGSFYNTTVSGNYKKGEQFKKTSKYRASKYRESGNTIDNCLKLVA